MTSERVVRSEVNDDFGGDDDDEEEGFVCSRIELLLKKDEEQETVATSLVDADGDLLVPRRSNVVSWNVRWRSETNVENVGLQLWRGSLAMIEFILWEKSPLREFSTVLELGCGVGIIGLALSRLENLKRIVLTDALAECLTVCKRNLNENGVDDRRIEIRRLEWNEREQQQGEQAFDVIVAADCVYDGDATDALVSVLRRAAPTTTACYLTIERRVVFTTEHMREEAPALDYFIATCERSQLELEQIDLLSTVPRLIQYDRSDILLFKMLKK